VVAATGKKLGISVVRGSEEDVLDRYVACMDYYNPEVVVRITADNPLTCPEQLKETLDHFLRHNLHYCVTQGLPLGAAVDIFAADALYRSAEKAIEPYQREHINAYILDNKECFGISIRTAQGSIARPDLSFTMDTKEDWVRLNSIFGPGESHPWRISLAEAIERMDRRAAA
jgi:spore coat polysaccharide biosynthesis protein SpsF